MKEIRRAFHDVLNDLNKVTMKAGTFIELAKLKDIDSMSEKELKEGYQTALKTLKLCEQAAVDSGESVNKIKDRIYELLNVDTSEPLV